jgi:hypothetical protein
VPLVIGGQVERWGEERQTDASKEHYPKPPKGAWSKYLEKKEVVLNQFIGIVITIALLTFEHKIQNKDHILAELQWWLVTELLVYLNWTSLFELN